MTVSADRFRPPLAKPLEPCEGEVGGEMLRVPYGTGLAARAEPGRRA